MNEAPVTLLEWVPVEDIYRNWPTRSGGNTPLNVSRQGENFVFGPYPKDFTMTGIYYQKFQPLRTEDSTWYVVNAPEVLLYASLLEAEPFIRKDERLPVWSQLLSDAIDSIKDEEKSARYPSGQLQARVA